uniref:Ras GTPase-activating protein 1 n=1 Tax=Gallus gallus TaxID=9031 RepID=A0A8V0YI45_CHICK
MMAAEREEEVSVTSARMVGAFGGVELGRYSVLCRSKELGSQGHFLVGSGGDNPGAGGPALCSTLELLELSSGPTPLASGSSGAVTTGQGLKVTGGTFPEPGTVTFSLLPPQPPSLAGVLRTVEENDSLDGPEYEEEEVAIPLNAPPTNQWYHGKLDRAIAEERLWQAGKSGTYLIRESDRRPGSFVLSFLSKTNVNHFRIIAMCGDYYIGGRRFASLSDLIGYYSHVSCLLKGEKLFFPVAPPEPVEDRRRVRAILPYTKVPETDEISFLKGDMFIVHNELEDGWMWVTNLRTDEQGLIVEDLVEEVGREEDPHEGKIWFHGKISKQEAYNLLMTAGQVCSFLVRPSDNTPGDYSLYFRTSENIQRFKICPTSNNQFMMGGRYYNSIAEIIEHYKKEQIVEGYYLKDPIPMQHQEQVLNNTVDGKEIYNTIRHKTKDGFYKNIVKKGYLLKKSKGKRWKNLYFILEGNDSQLIYFESEKRATKPKGLIDLSVCSVYGVHDSLFGRPNCFQIVVQHFSEEHYIFYFAGETPEQTQDWMKALQMFCSLRKNCPGTSNKRLRQVNSLILHVEEAHTLPVKHFTNPYCNIYLNSVQVAKTHTREGQNPVWSEEFVFDDLSCDINRFEISLSNKTKKSKDPDILFMRCQLSRLQKGHATDEWFQLSSYIPLKGIEPGSLRVRARYSMEKIMPEEEYSEFKEIILQKELHVVYALSHVCGQDRTLLAGILLKIFLHEKLESLLLRSLNDKEISMEAEATTLFRATTLASTLMEQYMKATATHFVHHALKDCILKIMESKQSCELNPSKLEKNEDVNTNLAHLLSILSELVEKIFMAAEILPPTLRYIYGCLQKSVQNKWPTNTTMRTRVVSGFVFLRLICPAILNPRMFNIISDSPSPTAARTLTLVAKSVQNLANLVEFGAKAQLTRILVPPVIDQVGQFQRSQLIVCHIQLGGGLVLLGASLVEIEV